MRLKTRKL